jgi:hypothetical protein
MTISITPAVHEALVSNYSPVTLCPAESAPENGALPNFNQSERQAAALAGWTSETLPKLAIGIARSH